MSQDCLGKTPMNAMFDYLSMYTSERPIPPTQSSHECITSTSFRPPSHSNTHLFLLGSFAIIMLSPKSSSIHYTCRESIHDFNLESPPTSIVICFFASL